MLSLLTPENIEKPGGGGVRLFGLHLMESLHRIQRLEVLPYPQRLIQPSAGKWQNAVITETQPGVYYLVSRPVQPPIFQGLAQRFFVGFCFVDAAFDQGFDVASLLGAFLLDAGAFFWSLVRCSGGSRSGSLGGVFT